MKNLNHLTPGKSGKISHVGGEAELRNRLLEMGFTQGTRVSMIRTAPLGDPIELEVRGSRLSMRKSEASSVVIEDLGRE